MCDGRRNSPCLICGERFIIQGGIGVHMGRLICPNYRNEEIHGNIFTKESGMGFTKWNYNFGSEEQSEKSIKELVLEWNKIHKKD